MIPIQDIIQSMDGDEQNRFLLYQKQKNKRLDTHNIQLFKLLASGINIKSAAVKIYTNTNNKAFNVLKKRLLDSLINFIAIEGFKNDASNEMGLLKLLLTARILLKQQHYKTGFKLLNKITLKAESLELFAIAAEAYHTHVEYLHKDTSQNEKNIAERSKLNLFKLQQAEKFNLSFAFFRRSITENPDNHKIKNLHALLDDFFGDGTGLQESFTYKTLFQLMDITNEYASVYQSFHTITPFIEKTYSLIAKKESISDHHLYYHIQVIYFMANLYFRNKDFTTSEAWLEKMADLMQHRNHKYKNRFLLKYALLKSLNLHYNNQTGKAVLVAEDNLKKVAKPEVSDKFKLLLALAMYYFHLADLKKVALIMKSWNLSDSRYEKTLGIEWTAKKNLFEIIYHTEIENRELALSRIKSFKRRYKSYLKNLKNAFVFLKLIEMHLNNPENTSSQAFKAYAEKAIIWQEQNQEDIFVISFYAWLKSKMTRTALPQVLKNIIAIP